MENEKKIMALLWGLFNKMEWLNRYEFKKYLNDYKPSEIHFIEYIGNHAEANVTKLADAFYMTRGAISKLSKKLMGKDLIESYQKPDNRKEIYFRLTEKGQQIFRIHERIHRRFDDRDEPVFAQVSQAELENVLRFAEIYNRHLDQELSRVGFDIKTTGIR